MNDLHTSQVKANKRSDDDDRMMMSGSTPNQELREGTMTSVTVGYRKQGTIGDNPMLHSSLGSSEGPKMRSIGDEDLLRSVEEIQNVFDSNEDNSNIMLRSRPNQQASKFQLQQSEHSIKESEHINELSGEFIMRTMIPSSQRATHEYQKGTNFTTSAPQANENDSAPTNGEDQNNKGSYYLNFADEKSIQYQNTKMLIDQQT